METFADREALALEAAELIAVELSRAIAGRGSAAFVATGGTTPAPVYERLAKAPLDWSRVTIALSDERWVPPASPDSNEGMVRRTLMTGQAGAARLIPLWAPEVAHEAAAEAAEAAIAPLLPFDLVLLGMGEDGHFASLFPGSPALAEGLDADGERLCLAVPAGDPAPAQARITLTLAALIKARLIVLLITGEAKRRALEAAGGGADLPVRAILDQDRAPVRVFWSP